jgi:predicted NUDIX family phosphoesterase
MEQVLTIKNEDLDKIFVSSNKYDFVISKDKSKIYEHILNHNIFLNREYAETDFTSRQIIPYAILSYEDEIFVLKRTTKQSEVRLHNKLSIGIGGHINPIDNANSKDVILECLQREIKEEITIVDNYNTSFIGVIMDNTTEVSKVHIGIAFELKLSSRDVKVFETDKMEGEWLNKDEILKSREYLETWSQIVFDHYFSHEYI